MYRTCGPGDGGRDEARLKLKTCRFLAFFLVLGIAAAYYLDYRDFFAARVDFMRSYFCNPFITGNKRMLIALYLLIFFLGAFYSRYSFIRIFRNLKYRRPAG